MNRANFIKGVCGIFAGVALASKGLLLAIPKAKETYSVYFDGKLSTIPVKLLKWKDSKCQFIEYKFKCKEAKDAKFNIDTDFITIEMDSLPSDGQWHHISVVKKSE